MLVAYLVVNLELKLHGLDFLNVVWGQRELNLEILSKPIGVATLIDYLSLHVALRAIKWRFNSYKRVRGLKLVDWVLESHCGFNLDVQLKTLRKHFWHKFLGLR